jgi:ferrous iron transport protein A
MVTILSAAPACGSLDRVDRCLTLLEPWAPSGTFPLRLAREGERVRIATLGGGPGSADRFAGMGLRPGAELQVLCNPMDGQMVVALGDTRLFLGGGLAQAIQVVPSKGVQA